MWNFSEKVRLFSFVIYKLDVELKFKYEWQLIELRFEFILKSDKPDVVTSPITFNDDNNVDAPETNKLVKLVSLNNDVM